MPWLYAGLAVLIVICLPLVLLAFYVIILADEVDS